MSNQGRFIWYELMSTDPKAALNLYSGLTGWSHKSWDADYDMWMIGDRRMAGCFKLPSGAQEQGAPTHWVGYIHLRRCRRQQGEGNRAGRHRAHLHGPS